MGDRNSSPRTLRDLECPYGTWIVEELYGLPVIRNSDVVPGVMYIASVVEDAPGSFVLDFHAIAISGGPDE